MRDRWLGIVGHLQDWISYSILIAGSGGSTIVFDSAIFSPIEVAHHNAMKGTLASLTAMAPSLYLKNRGS